MEFEFKTEEMRNIINDCENNNYGIVFCQSVQENIGTIMMNLEMQGYSINHPADDLEEGEGYNPDNYILTMVRVNEGGGMIREMEITPELAEEVKKYQEFLRNKRKDSQSGVKE